MFLQIPLSFCFMMGVSSAYRNTLSVYKRGKVVIQMKKVYAVNICVLIVMFLTAGAAAKPADDDKMMKQLIAQRIEIRGNSIIAVRRNSTSQDQISKKWKPADC